MFRGSNYSRIGNKFGASFQGLNPAPPFLWIPTDVTGSALSLWYKADSLTLNDGDAVSSWTDSSGNNRHATMSGSNRPVYKTNIQNSYPSIRFDGSNDYLLITSSFTFNPGMTISIVVNASGSAAGSGWISGHTTGNDYDSGDAFSMQIQTQDTKFIFYYRGSRQPVTTSSLSSPVILTMHVVEEPDSNLVYINTRKNGQLLQTDTINASETLTPTQMNIGARYQPTLQGPFYKGDIHEVVVYNKDIGQTQVENLENYLNSKYQIY